MRFLLTAVLASCLRAQDPFQEAERALAEQRYADAEAAYEKLKAANPAVAEVHARLGLVYFQQGKFSAAVPALRQALKLKPALPNLGVLLAMSLAELGRYEEALPGLERGFRQSSDAALKRMAGLQLQRALTGLQKDQKAVEVALELTRLYPDDPEVLYHSARLFGNYAYLAMRRLSEVAPQSVWRHQAAGEAHHSQGNYDLAIAEYKAVLALDPGRPGIHFRMGQALLAQPESQAAAVQEFEQELAIDPTNANAAYEAAELHRRAGRTDKAAALFESAVKHYPDFQEALVGLGRTELALGKAAQAVPHLEKAVKLNPQDEVAHFQLSRAQAALGNTAAQRASLATYQRLRDRKSNQQQERAREAFSLRPVTRQEADPQ